MRPSPQRAPLSTVGPPRRPTSAASTSPASETLSAHVWTRSRPLALELGGKSANGGVWGADDERARTVAKRLRTGQVEVNGGRFNPNAPFGGYKQSGIGREYGKFGLEEFLEVKAIQL